MRFSIATVLAFATAAMAQVQGFNPITKPTKGEKVPAGSTYEIVWQPSAAHPGSIKIGLLGGSSPSTLSVVDTIAEGVDSKKGSFSWQVGKGLGKLATYGIMITLEADPTIFQYGFPFQIVGGSGSSSGSSTATGSATSSATETSATTGSSDTSTTTSTGSSKTTSTTFSTPSSTITSTTIRSNLTTTSRGPGTQTTVTSVVVPGGGPSTTSTGTGSLATNGVASVAAGSFALFGGVAMAVLAL